MSELVEILGIISGALIAFLVVFGFLLPFFVNPGVVERCDNLEDLGYEVELEPSVIGNGVSCNVVINGKSLFVDDDFYNQLVLEQERE